MENVTKYGIGRTSVINKDEWSVKEERKSEDSSAGSTNSADAHDRKDTATGSSQD